MAYDPVFDRQMFQPKSSKGKGIVALADDNADTSDLAARRQRAMEMLAQAKQEQDPANYQTLSDRERPMVFRPTAVNLPQQPQQPPVAQQMAQMQAAGLRPVGMAEGGIAHFVEGGLNTISPTIAPTDEDPSIFKRFSDYFYPNGPKTMAVGSDAKYTLPDVGLHVGKVGQTAITREPDNFPARPEFVNRDSEEERAAIAELRDRYGPDVVDKLFEKQAAEYNTPRSRIARGIRSLLGDNPPSKAEMELTLKAVRDTENAKVRPDVDQASYETKLADMERQRRAAEKAVDANPVPGLFDASTEAGVARAQAAQQVAKRKAVAEAGGNTSGFNASIYGGGPSAGQPITSGFGLASLPEASKADATTTPVVSAPIVSAPIVSAPDTTQKSGDKDHPTDLKDIKAGKDNDFWMAVTRAGLGMAAGRSSNPLTNIAEGGIQGLEQYATKAARDRAANLEERKLGITEQHYKMLRDAADQRAENTSARLGLATEVAQMRAATAAKKDFKDWLTSAEGMQASDPKNLMGAAIVKAKQKEFEDYYGRLFHKQAALTASSSGNGLGLDTDLLGGE